MLLLLALPMLSFAAPGDPPLDFSADNMSGTHGPEGDIVLLNGNVRIVRGRTVITADNGRYVRAQEMIYLDRRVRMLDSTTTLTCDHASFSKEQDLLEVSGNVVVVDKDATLKAPSGTYDRRHGRADLYGGVAANDSSQAITCDQVAFYRDSSRIQARGRVVGNDKPNRLELRARSVDYDRTTREAVATGDPVLASRDEDGRVTELRAVTLRVNNRSRIAEAIDSVRVDRDTLKARADYALFDDAADRGYLLGHPRAWDDETLITGDTLEVWTEKRTLRRFVVRNNAVIDYKGARPNSIGEASRLSGQRIDMFFTRRVVDSLVAIGSARNDYTAVPRAKKTPDVNRAEGDTITVFFKDRKIERAVVQGKAEGEYHFAVAAGDTAAARKEVVLYDAPHIEFFVPRNQIVLDRQSHLIYRELELHARRVEFNSQKQTLVATGSPELADRGEKVSGHLMSYDLTTRTGNIYQAETMYEKGLYHGERIRKIGDNQLEVLDGSYSTCNLDEPHYHFQSHEMKIYLRDKLVARPVVFYIKNVPILALPFYVFPIKPGRHSGFLFPQFEFGLNNRAGQFIRNAGYYWAPNDYFDLTTAADYYQAEPSWVVKADGQYKVQYLMTGDVGGSFAKSERDQTDRWNFTADHAQDLTPRTRFVARASFLSSRDYLRDPSFGTPLSDRLQRYLTSSLSLSHYANWVNVNAVLDRRQDLDADESLKDPDGDGPLPAPAPGTIAGLANLTESAPNVTLGFPTRTLGTLGFLKNTPFEKLLSSVYLGLGAQYLSQRERRASLDAAGVIQQNNLVRRAAAGNASVTDSRKLLGWLTVAPTFQGEGVVFDHDVLGKNLVPTGTWSAGLSTRTTFYGTFRTRLGRLEGLRHVVSPSVSFSYSPEFPNLTFVDVGGIRRDRFQGFGGIGVSGFKNQRMAFSLDQRLQVKWRGKEQVQRIDNLLAWSTSGSYNFLWREQGQAHPLSVLGSSVTLQPPGLFTADLGWQTDVYSQRPVRALAYNVGMAFSGRGATSAANAALPLDHPVGGQLEDVGPWSLSLAYSYTGGYANGPVWSSGQTANGVVHFNLSPAWKLDYAAAYDVSGHHVLTQNFVLTRDLHCWEASFTRTFNPGAEAEYYFKLGIKDQKEIYVERGTRQGSIGGIR